MNQIETLLMQIGSMEGRVISPHLARQCRTLAGYADTVMDPDALAAQQLSTQATILFLRDLGGERKYTVTELDDEPEHYVLGLRATRFKGQRAVLFALQKK